MRFTYSEMWWFTSSELRVALVLMFLARLAYLRVLSVSSNDDEAPLYVAEVREIEGRERGRVGGLSLCCRQLRPSPKPLYFPNGEDFVMRLGLLNQRHPCLCECQSPGYSTWSDCAFT